MKYLSQVNAQEETTLGDKKVRLLQKDVDGTKTSRAENQMFTFQCEKPRRGLQVEVKQKEKRKQFPKRGLHPFDREQPMFVWRFVRIQALTEQGRQMEGTTFHILRQVDYTEIRRVTEKVVMTEVVKSTQKLTDKSPTWEANRLHLVQNSRREVAREEHHIIIGMSQKC